MWEVCEAKKLSRVPGDLLPEVIYIKSCILNNFQSINIIPGEFSSILSSLFKNGCYPRISSLGKNRFWEPETVWASFEGPKKSNNRHERGPYKRSHFETRQVFSVRYPGSFLDGFW